MRKGYPIQRSFGNGGSALHKQVRGPVARQGGIASSVSISSLSSTTIGGSVRAKVITLPNRQCRNAPPLFLLDLFG